MFKHKWKATKMKGLEPWEHLKTGSVQEHIRDYAKTRVFGIWGLAVEVKKKFQGQLWGRNHDNVGGACVLAEVEGKNIQDVKNKLDKIATDALRR